MQTPDKSFVGREADVEALLAATRDARFVVLLGPGGAGKTRLARWFVAHHAPVGATYFCDLCDARSKADVVRTVATALRVTLGAGTSDAVADDVGRALAALCHGGGDALVVLDNLETIGDGAEVVARWISSGPRFIGTSRTKLNLPGERDLEVGPLSEGAALALFTERARVVAPEFEADDDTRALVARLEGSPLAIELAAARAHVLAPRALLDRFGARLDLLRTTAGSPSQRGLPARHRSLRAVVEGSWALSSEADRAALSAASVFRGGFDLDAAEAVLGADAADAIESLLASSLVHRAAASGGPPRFALYESVREFAAERLAEAPERKREIEGRHAAHYTAVANAHAEGVVNAEPLARIVHARESENLLAAFRTNPRAALVFNSILHWALPADAHLAMILDARARVPEGELLARTELEIALSRAIRRGVGGRRALAHAEEGARLAALAGSAELLVEASHALAFSHFDLGHLDVASEHAHRTVEEATRLGLHPTAARTLDLLGWIAIDRGDFTAASQLGERALAIGRDRGLRLVESFAENLLGAVHGRRGDLANSQAHLERSLDIVRALEHRSQQAIVLGNLAKVAMMRGDLAKAREDQEAALAISTRIGARKTVVTHLAGLAAIDAERGDLAAARAGAAHAEALAREIQLPRQILVSTLLLGAIALEERRSDEAEGAFERARLTAESLGSEGIAATAVAGKAVARALAGDLARADLLLAEAREIMKELGTEARAVLDARDATVGLLARRRNARAILERSEDWATSSADVRLARRLALSLDERPGGSLAPPSSHAPPSSGPISAATRFELVTRDGIAPADALPADADLAFDAIARSAIVTGRAPVDLRKKPIAARLLEVLLGEPCATFDKDRLFVLVWHTPFRNASQGSALYKAVDRLAHLLDEGDARRFFRWDEAGRLAVVAKRPALLRSRVDVRPGS